jgi:aspartyl-tRNA(Asn)/glutamyl-tRNA(Gln) amidotransferase subunit B
MKLQPVIGLETHIQLKTKSKMFCTCDARVNNNEVPNTNICPICLGHPGVLPIPNKQAIEWAILLGLALGGEIAKHSKFDRKNYFYPDLPKAYQISQFDLPIMQNGHLLIEVPNEGECDIRIERLHLEEDAAKNIHDDAGNTLVDFNRGGTPLCEIVTKPDIHSSAQAKAYLQEMRLLARCLSVSDADMEKGQLRCDVNISLREVDDKGSGLDNKLHPKTEIKNVNSFRSVERAIEYEIKRQTELWEIGTPPAQTTTRGWNDTKQITTEHRTKEGSADYRYFPEPDIPPLELNEITDEVKNTMPELPWDKRNRFATEFGFKKEDIKQMIDDLSLADFAERSMSELGAWLLGREDVTEENVEEHRKKLNKLFCSWLLNKLIGLLTERKIDIRTMKITPENFAEFIIMMAENIITSTKGLEVLDAMLENGSDPEQIISDIGASRMDDMDALYSIIDTVIEENSKEVERYRAGEEKLIQFFVGQVMKATKGNADAGTTAKALKEKLK